ncbi:neurogenic locus notch homolog protein 1-like isoform X1 [Oncorhynchus keta]|uniref:neurogenic locus notch homolog protein 1-like isoform X1 n=1 Tax=Oncorhynchus keta TaxID=8018 RepID=UPI0015FAA0C6|nr:neurogenic locus notch homolog protein 1-like isoform X1 [Oncorhynchus keta]
MMLVLWTAVLLGLSRCCQVAAASPGGDPWAQCPSRQCEAKFRDGSCDKECTEPECLRDGFDCLRDKERCNSGHIHYCRDHYSNSYCDQGCESAACGWDGSDCHRHHSPLWAKGTLLLHTHVPLQHGTFSNSSLLWALSTLLQTPLKLRGTVPLDPSKDLFTFNPQQLENLLAQASSDDSNGSLLFLQVDNRPCSRLPSTCFPYAIEAANFLRAATSSTRVSVPSHPELKAIISVRGVGEEIGGREEDPVEEKEDTNDGATPPWIWAVIGVATGLVLALVLMVVLVIRRVRRRREEREGGGERVRHRSTVTENDSGANVAKAWAQHTPHREQRGRTGREKGRNGIKKKKAKEAEKKRRREPLGEDALRLRPLKKDLDIGSDTDFTQSSMEDINRSICDHRTQEQKHYRSPPSHPQSPTQPPLLAPPRGWERNAVPSTHHRTPNQSASVQWCGPDGSVVLIRAVRSGLDRVVLELLRAGVPVNNTDHTGRSALHWACSVNHLSLTRTLTRYGAAVDLQDNKGETALFLSALHGCYDTARFLLLNGANQDLSDRRGRRALDVAREGMHHQVLELLLAHRVQRGPIPMEQANDMLWDERAFLYSQWVNSPGLPGRSASFSGVIGHRDMSSPPPSDLSMGRVQCPSPQNWRPQLNQSATALVTPRIMGRPPRPISTLQEVTSEDEDRERPQEVPRAATPHFLLPQPAPRQRSFSCTQNALQRRSSSQQPEPTYVALSEKIATEPIERVIIVPPTDAPTQSDRRSIVDSSENPRRAAPEIEAASLKKAEQKARSEKLNNHMPDSNQTAL